MKDSRKIKIKRFVLFGSLIFLGVVFSFPLVAGRKVSFVSLIDSQGNNRDCWSGVVIKNISQINQTVKVSGTLSKPSNSAPLGLAGSVSQVSTVPFVKSWTNGAADPDVADSTFTVLGPSAVLVADATLSGGSAARSNPGLVQGLIQVREDSGALQGEGFFYQDNFEHQAVGNAIQIKINSKRPF